MEQRRCPTHGVTPASWGSWRCPDCGLALDRQVRCAWCLAWVGGSACSDCGLLPLDPQDLPAARFLVEAGVDRLSLAERVKALSRNQWSAYAARFDACWSRLLTRVEEARFLEAAVLTRGFAERTETRLLSLIPLSDGDLAELTGPPSPPFAGQRGLEGIETQSPIPEHKALASLALIHARALTEERLELARGLLYQDTLLALEAALALGRWFVPGYGLGRHVRERMRSLLRPWLADARLGPYAATALAPMIDPAELASEVRGEGKDGPSSSGAREIVERLRAGLGSLDEELRFACALQLGDEPALDRAADGGDAERARRAEEALAMRRSPLIHRRLAQGTDEVKLELIRGLRHPVSGELVAALLEGARSAGEEARRRALMFLQARPFAELEHTGRRAAACYFAEVVRAGPELAQGLGWALRPAGASDDPPAEPEEAPLFVGALSGWLEHAPPGDVALLFKEEGEAVSRWLYFATGPREVALLDRLLAEPALGRPLLEALRQLHARLFCYGKREDPRALELMLGLYDRAGGEGAELFAQVLGGHRGYSGGEALVRAFYRRYVERPAERVILARVLAPFRQEVKELRALEPKAGPLGPRDLVRFARTWILPDLEDSPALLGELLEQARQERGEKRRDYPALAPLLEELLPPLLTLAATRPCTAARAAAALLAHVANAFREDAADPALARAVAVYRGRHEALIEALDAARPLEPAEARYSHVVEHLEVELRLIREAEERQTASTRRDEERRIAEERRALEVVTGPLLLRLEAAERRAEAAERRAEAAERRAEAAERKVAELLGDGPSGARPDRWTPDLPRDPLDDEPLLPREVLPTLRDYVGFLKALSAGGDVLKLLAEHGLDPSAWAACAQAWSAVLQASPPAALRFGALMQATWRPPRCAS